jgi:hypothetical protein
MIDSYESLPNVTRIEVIDETGRVYVRRSVDVAISQQDNHRTLKIFVKPLPEPLTYPSIWADPDADI